MFSGLHGRPDLPDPAIGVNEKGYTMGALVLPAHEAFLAPHSVSLHYLLSFVRYEDEREPVLLDEFIVRFRRVGADPQDDGALLLERSKRIAEGTGLLRATWCIVSRVEVED